MARRKRKTHKPAPPADELLNRRHISTGLIVSIVITLILGGIPFGIGKYIELNSPGPFDSGGFVYSAQHLLQGARLGVDEHSSARPNTLLANVIGVAIFGFNETGPKLIQMLLQLAALVFMFTTLRKVFGSVAAVLGTTIAAVYLSAPLIAKFGNVKEQFMIPFMIAAACCFLLYGHSSKRYWLIASGFFAVQPYYFKPTGLSIVIAMGLCLIIGNVLYKKWRNLGLELGLFLGGYAIGLLVPGSLYIWQEAPRAMLYTLPVVLLEAAVVFGIIIAGCAVAIILIKKYRVLKQLATVSKQIWIAGLCLMVVMLVISIGLVAAASDFDTDDIASYIHDIPMVSGPLKLVRFVDSQIARLLAASGLKGGYVSTSWGATNLSVLAPRIFRYYKALCVPILLALASMVTAAWLWGGGLFRKSKNIPDDIQSKLVWLLAIWWILDMAFVWGSPRSYEQYYLPLCASGAMLSGFVVWKWQRRFALSGNKMPWLAAGLAAAITLGCLTIPIFIGQRYSPDTGDDRVKRYGLRYRGFGPALKELPSRKKNAWIAAGDFIRTRSTEEDKIYVWGWYPGIYVQAQRLAPVSRAFYGDMHVTPPHRLASMAQGLVRQFEKNPPKYIVDTRKIHFPNNRPPLELWPHTYSKNKPYGSPLPNDPAVIAQYDLLYKKLLAEQFDPNQKEFRHLLGTTCWFQYTPWAKAMPDEAERYEAMKPFREFVRNQYKIVNSYGSHVLFVKK